MPDRDFCAAQYEALRSQMIGRVGATPRGVGLALLLQKALAAWIAAVERCASPGCPRAAVNPSGPIEDHRSAMAAGTRPVDVLPPAQYTEVARLLAGLVLSARPRYRGGLHDEGGFRRC
jgi:hypothetical protein